MIPCSARDPDRPVSSQEIARLKELLSDPPSKEKPMIYLDGEYKVVAVCGTVMILQDAKGNPPFALPQQDGATARPVVGEIIQLTAKTFQTIR